MIHRVRSKKIFSAVQWTGENADEIRSAIFHGKPMAITSEIGAWYVTTESTIDWDWYENYEFIKRYEFIDTAKSDHGAKSYTVGIKEAASPVTPEEEFYHPKRYHGKVFTSVDGETMKVGEDGIARPYEDGT